jgi:hypothetical protein
MLVKYVSIDGIPQTFVFFRFVDIMDITVHDRFWNVDQANCILKYFENLMIDHSETLVKRFFFTCMEFIQFKLLCFNLIL